MAKPLEQLEKVLKLHGQSITRTRQIVFTALIEKEPQTMQELYLACGAVNRASVYRVITLFEHLGIVKRLQMGWKYKLELSDAFQDHHHHLTCQHCGRIIPFDEPATLKQQLNLVASQNDFAMQDHLLEIQGLCQNCRASS